MLVELDRRSREPLSAQLERQLRDAVRARNAARRHAAPVDPRARGRAGRLAWPRRRGVRPARRRGIPAAAPERAARRAPPASAGRRGRGRWPPIRSGGTTSGPTCPTTPPFPRRVADVLPRRRQARRRRGAGLRRRPRRRRAGGSARLVPRPRPRRRRRARAHLRLRGLRAGDATLLGGVLVRAGGRRGSRSRTPGTS